MLKKILTPRGSNDAPAIKIPKGSYDAVGNIWAATVYSQDPSLLGAKAWEALVSRGLEVEELSGTLDPSSGLHLAKIIGELCAESGIQEIQVGALGGPGRSPLPGFPPVLVQAASHLCPEAIELFHNNIPPGVGTSVESTGAVTVFASGVERVVWTPQVTPE